MIDVLYSPICEKLPVIRAIARQHGLNPRELNVFALSPAELSQLPGYLQAAIARVRSGEDGFYAWKVFRDGQDITRDFESLYPVGPVCYPDLSWREDLPLIELNTLQVVPLTRSLLENGFRGPGAFCLGGLHGRGTTDGPDWAGAREIRAAFLGQVERSLGCFGSGVCQNGLALGFVTFMPKETARQAGYYTARTNKKIKETLTLGCIYVHSRYRREGLSAILLRSLQNLALDQGFERVEAAVSAFKGTHEYTWWTDSAFRRTGFRRLEDREYDDGYAQMSIWDWCPDYEVGWAN